MNIATKIYANATNITRCKTHPRLPVGVLVVALILVLAGCAQLNPANEIAASSATTFLYEETDEALDEEHEFAEFQETNKQPFILLGTLILPDNTAAKGGLLVEDGIIQNLWHGDIPDSIADDLDVSLSQVTTINTNGIILPGLVDLHNHVAYNFLPLWDSGQSWPNRYKWAKATAYKHAVSEPYGDAKRAAGLIDEMNKYGEVRALVGGTTSILGAAPSAGTGILVRNIDQKTLGQDSMRTWVGSVLEFGCSRGKPRCPQQSNKIGKLKTQFDSGKLQSIVFHVAEGVDAESKAEFDWFVDNDMLIEQALVTHGTALGSTEFLRMGQAGMGLLWSPRSNIELYGKTTDVKAARRAGVRIALAPDWSPSGSDNLLAELRYAARYNRDKLDGLFTAQELVTMVTSIPAELAGKGSFLGKLEETFTADLLVLEQIKNDPYESIIASDERHVRLVTINGVALYGWPSWLKRLGKTDDYELISVRGRLRALDVTVPAATGVRKGTQSFEMIRSRLQEAYAPYGELPGLTANDP